MQQNSSGEESDSQACASEGVEWLVDAVGCDPVRLADRRAIEDVFAELIDALQLHPVQPAAWHQFPGHGGITGVCLLAESHLCCHTFPERGSICLNLFCCKPRPEASWELLLRRHLGADTVQVVRAGRRY